MRRRQRSGAAARRTDTLTTRKHRSGGTLANAALLLIRYSGTGRIRLLRIRLQLLWILLLLWLLRARCIAIRSSIGAVVSDWHSSAYRHGTESLA